jgi:hypothetical protein
MALVVTKPTPGCQQRMRISGTHMEIRSTGRAALDAMLFLAASNPVLYWSQDRNRVPK